MNILFDQGTPVPLRQSLRDIFVETVFEIGWARLSNGDLLREAESKYDVLVTTDQNLRYQQNLAGRDLGVFVLPTTSWPVMKPHAQSIASAVLALTRGEYLEYQFPG